MLTSFNTIMCNICVTLYVLLLVKSKDMDYKYIEQLLDSYFEAETNLEEENILRAYFCRMNIPSHLRKYVELFREQSFGKNAETLGSDFDARIMQEIGMTDMETTAKTRKFSFKPLWRAAACVAIVLALGQAAQMPYSDTEKQQQEQMARTYEMLQKVQQDQNSVAQGDSIVDQPKTVN
mgnify:FL=1